MKSVELFVNKLLEFLLLTPEQRQDVIDVLRLAYHTQRQAQRLSPFMSRDPASPFNVYSAGGGRFPSSDKSSLLTLLEVLEGELPAASDLTKVFRDKDNLETELKAVYKQLEKVREAKKVVELPEDAAALMRELADTDEAKLEAKAVRRTFRRLQEHAKTLLQGKLEYDE